MKTLLRYAPCLAAVLFSACASTYQVKPVTKTDNNSSPVSVYRKGFLDFTANVKIYSNGVFIGKVGPKRYIKWYAQPGSYLIEAKSLRKAKCDIEVAANKNYQIIVQKRIGIIYGLKLRQVNDSINTASIEPPKIITN